VSLGRRFLVPTAVAGAIVIASVGFAIVNSGGGSGGGPSGAGQSSGNTNATTSSGSGKAAARVPHNNVAVIYNEFGAAATDTATLDDLTSSLQSDGYTATRLQDSTEGAGSRGSATLPAFVAMAKTASVIIINTHGADFAGNSQDCTVGKGISQCSAYEAPPPAASPYVPRVSRSTLVQPVLQVEWYPTWDAEQAAFDGYVGAGYDPSWIFDPKNGDTVLKATTLLPWRPGDTAQLDKNNNPDHQGGGTRPWLGITAAGIAHFFKGQKIDLIDNLACHSISMASSFAARSYLGHASTACSSFEAKDEPTLFDRLTGKSGISLRSTTAAMAAGGFVDTFFQLAPGSTPVVLSPAVEAVKPAAGVTLKPGQTNPATIRFDAQMDQRSPGDVVSVSGCGASVQNPAWSAANMLSFGIKVDADPKDSRVTVTVHHSGATAEPGGSDNQQLDGNVDPSGGDSGVAPNRDDYTYKLPCKTLADYTVTVRYAGTRTTDFQGSSLGYHLGLTWDSSQSTKITFTDGASQVTPQADGVLTASGFASSTGRDPNENCTYSKAPAAQPAVFVNGAQQDQTASGRVRHVVITAGIPWGLNANGIKGQPLDFSGECYHDALYGPVASYFYHGRLGDDPGNVVGRSERLDMISFDLDQLVGKPLVMSYPADYTYTVPGGGATEHIVVKATLTVSVE
jgi:hypothetical protein